MLFVSYSYTAKSVQGYDSGFDNMMVEDYTIEPNGEESLCDLTRIVEKDLERRVGYDRVTAKIMWWKIL